MNKDPLPEIVELAAAKLGEHFDAVQILASVHTDGGGTRCIKRGCGNWYARIGMAGEFLQQTEAEIDAEEFGRHEPPNDSESWKS